MLYITLALMGIVFVVANLSVICFSNPKREVGWIGAAISLISIPILSLAVPLYSLFVYLVAAKRIRPSRFLPVSTVGFIVALALASIPGILRELDYAKWRTEFSYLSIEERLPTKSEQSKMGTEPKQLKYEKLESLIQVEIANCNGGLIMHNRTYQLQSLHDESVRSFINSPGFGVIRMSGFGITREDLTRNLRGDVEIAQPKLPVEKFRSIDEPNLVPVADEGILEPLHRASVVDFVYPAGWGYFKDRAHVADFRSHRFSKVPESNDKLRVASIELIGWLHGDPAAYVSENLPSMKELRGAPTRPLDAFEEEGLAKLKAGDVLYIKTQSGTVRMLGAIRATKQCINCHEGKRGDLLGAFSYQLR